MADLPDDPGVPGWGPGGGVPPSSGSGGPGRALAGRALVATPTIGDERFANAVILMLEHDPSGALGLVLSTPGDVPVEAVLADWASRAASPAVVFSGGPVGTDRALGLVRLGADWVGGGDDPDGVVEVPGTGATVGLVDLSVAPGDLDAVAGCGEVRVFAGYAGWGAGQLDAELAVGAWWEADIGPGDVFTPDPDALWERVVARQGGTRALFARFTGDPSLN